MIDDLPPPDGPQSATTSPGAACSERPLSTGTSGRSWYVKWTSSSRSSPAQLTGTTGSSGGRMVGSRWIHLTTLSAAPRACASAV